MDLGIFLKEDVHIDHSAPDIQQKAKELFAGAGTDREKIKIAYEFVRDDIPHTFDCCAVNITAKASDVLKYKTGICHAKANLLAALLRLQNIPTGFCFQHLTIMDDDSKGYCVHCYNAVYVERRWIKIDARGNKKGVDAQLSYNEPILAFPIRKEYDEYDWKGIYASSHLNTMKMLEQSVSVDDIIENIPDYVNEKPDITE